MVTFQWNFGNWRPAAGRRARRTPTAQDEHHLADLPYVPLPSTDLTEADVEELSRDRESVDGASLRTAADGEGRGAGSRRRGSRFGSPSSSDVEEEAQARPPRRGALGVKEQQDVLHRIAPYLPRFRDAPIASALCLLVLFMTTGVALIGQRSAVTSDMAFGVFGRGAWVRDDGWPPALIWPINAALASFTAATAGELVLALPVAYFGVAELERVLGPAQALSLLVSTAAIRALLHLALVIAVFGPDVWFAFPASVAWLAVAVTVARARVGSAVRTVVVYLFGDAPSLCVSEHGIAALVAAEVGFLVTEAPFAVIAGAAAAVVTTLAPLSGLGLRRTATSTHCGQGLGSAADLHGTGAFRWAARLVDRFAWTSPALSGATARARFVSLPASSRARRQPAAAQPAAPAAMDPAAVSGLVELGYSQGQAERALREAGGDPNRAATLLLAGEIPHDA